MINTIKQNFKARLTAKRFNIWKERLCLKGEPNESYWLADDGVIYFGHPLLIFFQSSQNRWWLGNRSF